MFSIIVLKLGEIQHFSPNMENDTLKTLLKLIVSSFNIVEFQIQCAKLNTGNVSLIKYCQTVLKRHWDQILCETFCLHNYIIYCVKKEE